VIVVLQAIYSLAKTPSAPLLAIVPRSVSLSAYVTLPWSTTMAYLCVRSPLNQPIFLLNASPASEAKSYMYLVNTTLL
jgi:hypothetical protein